ncbi:MAG TPA: 4-hydroxythreonine-4-phosphate dehydrogenase PdxA, partial [Pyrinomonadaceae bacterium]|nr:4-hydroxythreonine-4-phosphate dehydrogenase PdxA [Pyrinomonadaceae bacterium]
MNTTSMPPFSNSGHPRIGITIGDAAGIGPEIVLKSLADNRLRETAEFLVIGDLEFLRAEADRLDLRVELRAGDEPVAGECTVHDLGNLPKSVEYGREDAICGRAAGEYIEAAVKLWQEGRIDAVATAPISKRSLSLGGYDFPGHTEFLAALTGTDRFAMSFFAGKLRVVLLSTHLSLKDAIARVTHERLADLIRFTAAEMAKLLGRPVKIAVAGLNPHASENGMFGSEEADEMSPGIEECRSEGIDVSGPFAADTVFLRCNSGEFDAVIACYHDQATIAVKCLSFGKGVNVTLGLPLIRTSVDHGTA